MTSFVRPPRHIARAICIGHLAALSACDAAAPQASSPTPARSQDAAQPAVESSAQAGGSPLSIVVNAAHRDLAALPAIDLHFSGEGSAHSRSYTARVEEGKLVAPVFLEQGRYRVAARAEGYVVDVAREVQVFGAQDPTTLALGLATTAKVALRLSGGAYGLPVADAEVRLLSATSKSPRPIVLSGREGAYWADAVSPGRYEVEIRRAGLCDATTHVIDVQHASQRFDIELTQGSSLSGAIVTEESGSADDLSGSIIQFSGPDGSGAVSAQADASGRFSLTGICGQRGALYVRTPGKAPVWRSEIQVDEVRREPLVVAVGTGRTLRFHVTAHSGEPIADARVVLEYSGHEVDPRRRFEVQSDADGNVSFEHVPEHPVSISVHPRERIGWHQVIEHDQHHASLIELRLPPPQDYTLRVVDDAGKPVPSASVSLRQGTRDLGTSSSTTSGIVIVNGYKGDILEAAIRAPGHVAARLTRLDANGQILKLARTASFELCLPKDGVATSASFLELSQDNVVLRRHFTGACASIAAILPGTYQYRHVDDTRPQAASEWQVVSLAPGQVAARTLTR